MKICWYDDWQLGLVRGDEVLNVSAALRALPDADYPSGRPGDLLITNLAAMRSIIEDAAETATSQPLTGVRLRSPVARPGKIIAAPVNYQAHLDEAVADQETFSRVHVRRIQETGLFLKATSSLIGAGDVMRLTKPDRRTDHEVELVAVIGRTGRNIPVADALDHVAGYCIGLDITIRGPEERSLRKSPDGYSVLGPWLTTADELGDPAGLSLSLSIDGKLRQHANTADLILGVAELIAFASEFYTLEPGDIVFTGTPEGVGPITPGCRINAEIARLGTIEMRVAEEGR